MSISLVTGVWWLKEVIFRNAIKNRMTIIKRKTFIIKHFARFAEQTDLQKKTKYCDVSVTRLLAACFGNNAGNRIFTDRNKADLYSLFINVLHAKGRFSKEYFYNLKKSVMKVEKFKVLLYLKKSEPDKTGKAPIMGRITLNRTMAQFSCKLSCTPGLWNARESRLNGKSGKRWRPMKK